VRKARLTAADLAGYRSNLLEWELQVEQADYECSLAALELGKLLGLTDTPSHLRAAEFPIPGRAAAIPSTGALYQLAFRQSNSYSDLRAKVEAEKRSLLAGRRIHAPDLSLAYANTTDRAGSKLGLGSGGYLLGGHSGSFDLGIRISLRPTGEGAALANAAASRIATLEYELTRLDEEARWEIDALRLLAVSSRRRAELAEHKLQIAEAAFHVAARRERAGLASRDTVVAAEFQITRLRAEHRQARSEHDARFAQLVAATRLDWNSPDLSRTLLAVAPNTSEVDHVE
jgi:outer membrane protein TolC